MNTNYTPSLVRHRRALSATFGFLLAGAMLYTANASAAVIYADDFSGTAGTALNGLAPDVRSGANGGSASAVWSADAQFTLNGSGFVTVPDNGGNPSLLEAVLPFTPDVGNIYTLKVDINPTNAMSGSNYLGFGFTSSLATSRSDTSTFGPWVRYQPNGAGTAYGSHVLNPFDPFGTAGSTSDPMRFTLTLNTTATFWTVTLDALNLTTSVVTSGSYTYTTNPTISGVFLEKVIYGGTFANFELATVPEPSIIALGALGLLVVGWRMRVRKMARL